VQQLLGEDFNRRYFKSSPEQTDQVYSSEEEVDSTHAAHLKLIRALSGDPEVAVNKLEP
jgi:hypothetical protein